MDGTSINSEKLRNYVENNLTRNEIQIEENQINKVQEIEIIEHISEEVEEFEVAEIETPVVSLDTIDDSLLEMYG